MKKAGTKKAGAADAIASHGLRVEFASDVQQQIRQHARSSMSAEICGVLLGGSDSGSVVVENAIAGEGAREAGTHVTFTQETWAHIYQIKDSKYPDKRIVGWYHSHPGFGVFLSEHDLFIHSNFFPGTEQIAWVYDPHSDEEGCFIWKAGKIEPLDRLHIVRTASSAGPIREIGREDTPLRVSGEPDADSKEKPISWALLTVTHIAMLIIGFLLGAILAPPIYVVATNPHATSPARPEVKK